MTEEVGRKNVQERMARAAKAAGFETCPTQLIAVSKTKPIEEIIPLLEQGQRLFGENRVQEAASKWPQLRETYKDIELHLIGPLQSNKVKDAVALFDVIQSVDRPKIAKSLAKEMGAQNKTPRLMVQVNTGEEPQKAGVIPKELGALLTSCQDDHGLNIEGLMCIPPVDQEPSLHFALLKKLCCTYGVPKCSMGMSSDFETAVQFGADYIRVGTALFGVREPQTQV